MDPEDVIPFLISRFYGSFRENLPKAFPPMNACIETIFPEPVSLRARLASLALVATAVCGPIIASEAVSPKKIIVLFNGHDLTGWTIHARDAAPAGTVMWGVADGVIKCTGKPSGYIRTTTPFRNYRLTVSWRWVPLPPPTNSKGEPLRRNSGVLIHMQGEDVVWPKECLECQLLEGNAGDLAVGSDVETEELRVARAKAVAAAGSDEKARARGATIPRMRKQKPSSEKPIGEWNTYDIVSADDTVTVRVNGVEQNRATRLSVSEGFICLQSEGVPIEFRDLKLRPLK